MNLHRPRPGWLQDKIAQEQAQRELREALGEEYDPARSRDELARRARELHHRLTTRRDDGEIPF